MISPSVHLFDSHTHLYVDEFDRDRSAVLERARRAGIDGIVVVGLDLPSSRAAIALAEEAGLYATVGIQPHYADQTDGADLEEVRQLARHPRVVALGEIGLDYYRDRAPRPRQRQLLRRQLALAREVHLPVVIHCRQAHEDLLEELRRAGPGLRGVMHCFSGTLQEAQAFLERGLHISLAGPVTYPRAERTWEVARQVPLERLLLETDCPWLPPQSHRGRRNEPAYLVETAGRVAELRGLGLDELAQATTENARRLFLDRSR